MKQISYILYTSRNLPEHEKSLLTFIQTDDDKYRKVVVYSSAGKALLKAPLTARGLRVDKLSSGIYTAVIESGDGLKTAYKFIKK